MKTQISNLRSGKVNQVLNDSVDYSILPKSTNHNGHAGSNSKECQTVWEKVITENPEYLVINIYGFRLTLKANWSLSAKTVYYVANVPELLFSEFPLEASKNNKPYIAIYNASDIEVHNGKNSFIGICPSLIEIV